MKYQCQKPPAWPCTMSVRLSDCAAISTPTSAKPMAISYDTICAAERMAPRKAYLELDAQPAMITPYTPIEVIAITYSNPALILASTSVSVNGITAHAASAGAMARMGPRTNSP